MIVDRYTKAVLTVIAAALVWIATQQSFSEAVAQSRGQQPMPVFITQISDKAAQCIGAHSKIVKGDTGPCIAVW